ncbi:hypothetical protein EC2731150_1605 [Escherichia coli 2731150]|nr:hypothetical protein EC2731150_1605 [Escherichia coli 2731150]
MVLPLLFAWRLTVNLVPVPPLVMALSPSLLTTAWSPSIWIPMDSGAVTVMVPLLSTVALSPVISIP